MVTRQSLNFVDHFWRKRFYGCVFQRPDLWVSTDKVWLISPKYFCLSCFQSYFWKKSKLNSSWTLKFLELHTLFILSLWKKLTPMAVVYQVRCPSVSGTGADWRNLELSPLPLSNDQYILNKRRYHQPRELCHSAIEKGIQPRIYQIWTIEIWFVG